MILPVVWLQRMIWNLNLKFWIWTFVLQDCKKFKSKKTGRGPLSEDWKVSVEQLDTA